MKKTIIFTILATLIIAGGVKAYTYIGQAGEEMLGGTTLTVPRGGTGATSFTAGECLVGNGTSAITSQACGGGGGDFATTTADYWLTTKDTADLTEGTNLYYTDVRVADYINASSTLKDLQYYDNTTSGFLTSTDINTYSKLNTIVADETLAYGGGAFHDGFSDFVANEHIDWTTSQAPTVIHADNYTDTNTTYTAGGTLLDLTGTTFSLNEGTLTNTKYCTYEAGTGIVCNSEGGGGASDGVWVIATDSIYNATTTDTVLIASTTATSLDNAFEVTGTSLFTGDLSIGAGSGDSIFALQNAGTDKWFLGNDATDDVFKISTSSDFSAGNILQVTNTGNGLVTIQGGLRLTDNAVSAGAFVAFDGSGNLIATSSPSGAGTVTSVAMSVPTGLSISGSPIVDAGTLALTYTAGYEGLLTASSSNWNTFYDTPSNRITAGTGLSWDGNTLNGSASFSSIAGLNATFSGESVASTTNVWDFSDYTNATASNGATISGDDIQLDINGLSATSSAIDADTLAIYDSGNTSNKKITWANIKATLKTYFDGLYQTILTFGIGDTNAVKIDGAGVADNDYAKFTATGLEGRSYSELRTDIGLDTTGFFPSFTYATSTTFTGTTTIPLGTAYVAETWVGVQCFTDTGTVNVAFNDGTNYMDMFNASTTVGTIGLSTNNTFTAGEKRYVDIGTPASSPTTISCTVKKTLNPF